MKKTLLCLGFIFTGIILQAQCNFKPIGHRGGSSYNYPENTLISLEQGFLEDIFAAEVDVRSTSDSILVLMHDYYVDRTTNGTGEVEKLSLSYLKTLDAGSWKDPIFTGTSVPTLKEALLVAEKFHKKLYLNMKIYDPQLIAKTLKEANVSNDIILLDPDDMEKVEAYHKILPETPLVYFGDLPLQIDDPDFYTRLKYNGVVAIEIPASYFLDAPENIIQKIRDMAHSYNLELWSYTVNDTEYFKLLKGYGIDGLETDRPVAAKQVFCNNTSGGLFPEKRITGQWNFNNNLYGTIGSKLVLIGDTSVNNQKIKFGTTSTFGLPKIDGSSVNIAQIPAFDPDHALRFFSNIYPEGFPGGFTCDNTYSLIFDILKPTGKNLYTAIFQTSNSNSDDADFFLRGTNNSFGILGNYNGSFDDSTWVRLSLVFDLYNEKMVEYLDGNYVATVKLPSSQDGRFCINNNWGVQSSNFFSDDDYETNPIFVSSIQLRNYAMDSCEIKLLGKPKSTKIESVNLLTASAGTITGTSTVHQGQNGVTYTVTEIPNATSYVWTLPAGATGTSETNSITVNFSVSAVSGNITVKGRNDCGNGTESLLAIVVNSLLNHDIALNVGWNIISTNVVPTNVNLKDIFQPHIDSGKLKKVMDESGKTVENFGIFGGWKNNIGNLLPTEGYKVNMLVADTLRLEGALVPLPLDIPLTAGWNIISYPCKTAQDGKALVQSLIDAGKISKVMDESGKTIENFGIFGGWKNNIGNFVPGKGYKVKVASDTTLTIPAITTKAATYVPEVLASTYFTKVFEGNGTDHMNISLVDLQTSGLQVGDEIGVFDGKYCVGSATIGIEQLKSGSISIPTSANEGSGATVNGFTTGNTIGLQLYRGNQSYPLEAETLSVAKSFEKNGSVFLKVSARDLPVVQTDNGPDQFRCYPNPFKDELTVEIRNSEEAVIDVAIYNLLGQKIKNLYKGTNKGELMLKWNGTNDSGHKVSQGVYLCKMNGQAIKVVYKH